MIEIILCVIEVLKLDPLLQTFWISFPEKIFHYYHLSSVIYLK